MDTEITVTFHYLGNTVTIPTPKSFEQLVHSFFLYFHYYNQPSVILSYQLPEIDYLTINSEEDYFCLNNFLYRHDISNIDLDCVKSQKIQTEETNLSKNEVIAQQFYFMKTKDKVLNSLKRNVILQRHLVSLIQRGYMDTFAYCFSLIKKHTFELKAREDCSFDNDTKTNSFDSILCIENINHSYELKNDVLTESVLMNDLSCLQLKDIQLFIDEDYDYLFLQEMIILIEEKKRINCIQHILLFSPVQFKQELLIVEIDSKKQNEAKLEYGLYSSKTLKSPAVSKFLSLKAPLPLFFYLIEEREIRENQIELFVSNKRFILFLNNFHQDGNRCLKAKANQKITKMNISHSLDVSIYILLTYLNFTKLYYGVFVCYVYIDS